jgi:NADH:ubiquinone oxidoreductase subunit E
LERTATEGKEGLPGFFGVEQPPSRDEFDPTVLDELDRFLEETPGGQERLIPILHLAQSRLGYLPVAVQEHVAERLGLSPIQVYGVISFYHFFTTTPRARYQVKICMGTACFVRNAQRMLAGLTEVCRTGIGGISDDGLFNLDQVRCIGACGLAPAIMINDEVHGNLTAPEARELAEALRAEAEAARPAVPNGEARPR